MQSHILESALARVIEAERLATARAARVDGGRPAARAGGPGDVTIRFARGGEQRELARLAALDSHSPLPAGGPVLVAEMGGDLVAAMPLGGGPVLADPFRRTADVAALLEVRAAQLRGGGSHRPHGRLTPAAAR